MKSVAKILIVLALPTGLGACAETQFVIQGAKEITGSSSSSGNGSQGDYKVGKPYRIAGVWYYPAEDFAYTETGVASWYGPKFHGKSTANGDVFDMNELTAAHRTLPMPSMVRVTNLRNGRSLKLLVNDRGPFAHGRIIDVSRRAAQLLGFKSQGTTRVRVEIVPDESRRLKYIALNGKLPPEEKITAEPAPVQKVAALPLPAAAPGTERIVSTGTISTAAAEPVFVQAGAYADRSNASRARALLTQYGAAQVSETKIGRTRLYRVRLGPLDNLKRADDTLARVISAGFPHARIVVD
jgi:rare lipoprotein A